MQKRKQKQKPTTTKKPQTNHTKPNQTKPREKTNKIKQPNKKAFINFFYQKKKGINVTYLSYVATAQARLGFLRGGRWGRELMYLVIEKILQFIK